MGAPSYNVEKRKRVIRNASLIFLIIIILLTFFSKTISNFMLPVVECKNAYNGRLDTSIDTTGELKVLNTYKVTAYGAWVVKSVEVKESSTVKKGDVLAFVDREDVMLDLEMKEIDVLNSENELVTYRDGYQGIDLAAYEDAAAEARNDVLEQKENLDVVNMLYENGADSLKSIKDAQNKLAAANKNYEEKMKTIEIKKAEKDINEAEYRRSLGIRTRELELKKNELQKLKENIPQNGEIRSNLDGKVEKVLVEAGSVTAPGQVIFEMSDSNRKFNVQFKLNSRKARFIGIGDSIMVTAETPENVQLDGRITVMEYLPQEDMYQFTCTLDLSDEQKGISFDDRQRVQVTAVKIDDAMSVLVPNSSVYEGQGGNCYMFVLKERKGILGDETYVEMITIEATDSDDTNTAISGISEPDANVVVNSTKALEDGMQVKVE